MDESITPTFTEQLCRQISPLVSDQVCKEWAQQATNHCVQLLLGENEPLYLWKCIKSFISLDRGSKQQLARIHSQIPANPIQIRASDCVALLNTVAAEYTYCVTKLPALQMRNQKLLGFIIVIFIAILLILFLLVDQKLKKLMARYSKPEPTFSAEKQKHLDYLDAHLRNIERELRRQQLRREDLALGNGRKTLVLKLETRQQFAKAIVEGTLTTLCRHVHLREWNVRRQRCAMVRKVMDCICRSDSRVLHVAIVLERERNIEQTEIDRALQRNAARRYAKKSRIPPPSWSRAVQM